MIFNDEFIRHLIKYVKDYPDRIHMDTFREDGIIVIRGNFMGTSRTYTRSDTAFQVSVIYDVKGDITGMNGAKFSKPNEELKEALQEAFAANFKLRKKKIKMGVITDE